MIKFQKNNDLEIQNEEISKRIKEIYELKDDEDVLGYATINEDKVSPIYIYVKEQYRGNRIWQNSF